MQKIFTTCTPNSINVPPAIESLLQAGCENSFWPAEIKNHPGIRAEALMRRALCAKLEALFGLIPLATTEVTQAVDSGKVHWGLVTDLYAMLADFLDADPRHKRLILYLPFELVPSRTWRPPSPKLADAANRFTVSYTRCWNELLAENDVRANFVDGNILEPEVSPTGQRGVCKAAHLIPQLVERKLISVADVLALMDTGISAVLKESIADTLPTLVAMSQLAQNECDRIRSSFGLAPLAKKEQIGSNVMDKIPDFEWLRGLAVDAAFEIRKMEMRSALDGSRGIPGPRVTWDRLDKEDKLADTYADRIAQMLINNTRLLKDLWKFLAPGNRKVLRLAAMRGIGKAVESIANDHPKNAMMMVSAAKRHFRRLWTIGESGMRDELTSILSHWANLGLVGGQYLGEFGIEVPKLDALRSNSARLVEPELNILAPAIEAIAKNPKLSRLLYPVAIFFGSRLKGYARRNADLDVAVFVKDGISFTERKEVTQAASQTFSHKKIDGKIVEFWLAAEGNRLSIRDFPNADVSLADSTWIHVLLGGVLFGTEDALREIYAKLLPGFLFSKGRTLQGRDARTVWLGEIEREVLQYRLLHKGYRRFYPKWGGIKSLHAEGLNPQSAFWDSGYRRVATTLFIGRVFLPQIAE